MRVFLKAKVTHLKMFLKFLNIVHFPGTIKILIFLKIPYYIACIFNTIIITSFNFRLLDVIISESPEKLNKSLYKKYFINKIVDLVVHHNGNFTVQNILLTLTDVTQVII